MIAAVATTDCGMELGELLQAQADEELKLFRCDEHHLFAWTDEHFSECDALIYIGTTDSAVRAIAPFLRLKAASPAVIVIDEFGSFATPILYDPDGKANALAQLFAAATGGTAVIPSAVENVFDIDAWANEVGLKIANPEALKRVSSKLMSGGTAFYDSIFPIAGANPRGLKRANPDQKCDFIITYLSGVPEGTLHLVPPVLTLGVECAIDSTVESLEASFAGFLEECGCHALAVGEVCTESSTEYCVGLLEFCKMHRLPLKCFSAAELHGAEGSFFVYKAVGKTVPADSICERSAVLGNGGTLFVRETDFEGVSLALAIKEPK
ncbi:MAG: cobalamin biosynthesis protein [Oscillospiraceae bacterium]